MNIGGTRNEKEVLLRKLTVVESMTLDGVMQAPGRPDEDTRDGFEHGGWAWPYQDEVMLREMGKGMGRTELLFGGRTYEDFYSFWPKQQDANPFTEVLNNTQKYVASRTLNEPLPWVYSTLLAATPAKRSPNSRRSRAWTWLSWAEANSFSRYASTISSTSTSC